MGTWAWDLASDARHVGRGHGGSVRTCARHLPRAPSTRSCGSVHPNDVERPGVGDRSRVAAGDDLQYEHRVVWPNGEVHWLEGRGRVIHDADGRPVAMVGIGMDIDHRKASEAPIAEAVRLRSERARSAIQVLQETLVPADFPDDAPDTGSPVATWPRRASTTSAATGTTRFAVNDRQVLDQHRRRQRPRRARRGARWRRCATPARAFACEDADPGSIVSRLDNFFHHLRRGDEIVTALVGLLDTRRGTRSSWPRPATCRRSGACRTARPLSSTSTSRPPLGVARAPTRCDSHLERSASPSARPCRSTPTAWSSAGASTSTRVSTGWPAAARAVALRTTSWRRRRRRHRVVHRVPRGRPLPAHPRPHRRLRGPLPPERGDVGRTARSDPSVGRAVGSRRRICATTRIWITAVTTMPKKPKTCSVGWKSSSRRRRATAAATSSSADASSPRMPIAANVTRSTHASTTSRSSPAKRSDPHAEPAAAQLGGDRLEVRRQGAQRRQRPHDLLLQLLLQHRPTSGRRARAAARWPRGRC